ncbi:hypothetical protein KKF81_00240 [Candidatus Micrarchaeota archaeon]|nr:hypothetical protein [Candidatus Micrarchaeota archaeon]MBU1165346.1 hypothetical protein [Candidatus Micrarchaeota archaeon]MBU1886256.1 hypothetical protein [Candidatus Micrarchaeota archaeon]
MTKGEKWQDINRLKVAETIRKEMPQLEFVIWDLEPFAKGFHNWRKNMVFVECEELAVDILTQKLSFIFKSVGFYTGTMKKIKMREFNTGAINASIIVLARKDFKDTVEDKESNARIPCLEERVTDLLAYSLRNTIPMPVAEAANAISYVLSTNAASITKMHRYATRKYVDWLFKIILYQMANRGEIGGLDPRFTKAGERYLHAIKEVENRE